MTVQSSLARIQYTVSGAGPYSIPFMFLADADLVVYSQAAGFDPVLLTLTTDYTVTGAEDENGGTLTLVSPNDGETLTIINEPEIAQLVDYPEVGKFPAASHERALDKLTIIAKRIYDLAYRSLRLNDTSDAVSLELPTPEDGQLLGWSAGSLVNTSPAGVGPSSIGTTELADGAVTDAKLADGAVTDAKLASPKAGSGANSDITSLSGLTTALSIAQGGTGLTAAGAAGNVLVSDGANLVSQAPAGRGINAQTAQATTSGSSVTFSDIPDWVKRVTIMLYGVSLSGSDHIQVQLGVGGVMETSNYLGSIMNSGGGTFHSSAFRLRSGSSSGTGETSHGVLTLTKMTGNTWVADGVISHSNYSANAFAVSGIKALAGVLDSINIMSSGANTFDAGSVNIAWE